MIVRIEIDEQEEPEKLKNILQADKLQISIQDFYTALRENWKYKEDDPVKSSEDAWKVLYEILEENQVIWEM